jgi:hypothetical protein
MCPSRRNDKEFAKGAGARPSPSRLAKSINEVPTKGFNVWRIGTVTREDIRALGNGT